MSEYTDMTDEKLRSIIANRIGYDWIATVRPDEVYLNDEGVETIVVDGKESAAVRNATDGVLSTLRLIEVI